MPNVTCLDQIYDVEVVITQTDNYHRTVGTLSPDADQDELGWQIDLFTPPRALLEQTRDRYRSLSDDETFTSVSIESTSMNKKYMPVLSFTYKDAVKYTYWQPGVAADNDLLLRRFIFAEDDDSTMLVYPVINTGYYSQGCETSFLYSNCSVVQYPSPLGDVTSSGIVHSELTLDRDPDTAFPISAIIYERLSTKKPRAYITFRHVDEFTGTLTGTTRASTEDNDGNIIWTGVDNDIPNEFILSTEPYKAIFNKTAHLSYFMATDTDCDKAVACYLNCLGQTTDLACQVFYTTYFPLDSSSNSTGDLSNLPVPVKIFLYDDTFGVDACYDTVEEWTIVNTIDFSRPSDKHVIVDYDLGRIIFGGYQAPDTILCEDNGTTLVVADASQYAERGSIWLVDPSNSFNYEEVLYFGKDGDTLLNVLRARTGTVEQSWPANTLVEDLQKGAMPPQNWQVCAQYTAIPRVQYERVSSSAASTEDLHTHREVHAHRLDLQPFRHSESEGLLYIDRNLDEIANITLESLSYDLARGSSSVYGPVPAGVGVARVKATAYNAAGTPLPNKTITISLEGVGSLSTTTLVTGGDGSAVFSYNAPSNPNDLGTYSTYSYIDSGDTVFVFDDNAYFSGVDVDDIYLFQVTKDSPLVGSVGHTGTVTGVEASVILGAGGTTNAIAVYSDVEPEYFDGGIIYLTYDTGLVVSREITYFTRGGPSYTSVYTDPPLNATDIDSNYRSRIFHVPEDTNVPGATIVSYRAIELSAIPWDPSILNGRKSIIYRIADQVDLTHPSMALSTVYGPLRPDTILSDKTLKYSGSLTAPDPYLNSNLVGAYWSMSPQEITIKSYIESEACDGALINSGSIKFSLTLPDSMLGVYISDSVKIPYGFRILSETFSAASVIDAATFLTINPIGRFGSAGGFISEPSSSGSISYSTNTEEAAFSGLLHTITITN